MASTSQSMSKISQKSMSKMSQKSSKGGSSVYIMPMDGISLSTMTYSSSSNKGLHTPSPSKDFGSFFKFRGSRKENVTFADEPIYAQSSQTLRVYSSSEAISLKGESTVLSEGSKHELLNTSQVKLILNKIPPEKRNSLLNIVNPEDRPDVNAAIINEDDEPYYNKNYKKYEKPKPRQFEEAISYNVKDGWVEYVEQCIEKEQKSIIQDEYNEEDPLKYYTTYRKPTAPYVLKEMKISSFCDMNPLDVKEVTNIWTKMDKVLDNFATMVIVKLKEHESKKRVSINKIIKHKGIMRHGRLGMAFLSKIVPQLGNELSNQIVYNIGRRHGKYNFRPMLYELIINGFLLTLIEYHHPRLNQEQVSAFRNFLTVLFDIFRDGCNWNKHKSTKGSCNYKGY